ncbi:MAG TPA: PilN domain-containing protein [Burkholderiaceae bacterium]|nr:PilN domain-containing protein [Burkholderiaceae bacterium]
MKTIHIDFAPNTLSRTLYQTRPLAWLCIVGALIAGIGTALHAHTKLDAIAVQDAALRRAQITLDQHQRQQPVIKAVAITDDQAAAVNTAIAQLNIPWRDVFNAIEAATPKTIALVSLQPDAKRGLVTVVAEAKSSDDMIAYIEQLKKQSFLTGVWLSKHEINEQDPNKPLRFQLDVQWREVAP